MGGPHRVRLDAEQQDHRRAAGDRDSGEQQRLIRTIPRKGHRFVGAIRERTLAGHETSPVPSSVSNASLTEAAQAVTFCTTKEGIRLAVASVGAGPALVRTAHWVTSLEHDWKNPITAPLLHRLATRNRLIRYDGRAIGLSDRNVAEVSLATCVEDLETVVDSLQLERFALLGISGGAATAIAYAVRHPERVSKLVLYGGYALGRNKRGTLQDAGEAMAMLDIMGRGWGDEHSAFMRAHSTVFLPSGAGEEIRWMSLVGGATTSDNVAKVREAVDEIDVVDLLPKVRTPTIIFHCRHDHIAPFEQGRLLAASIPNAKFVALESDNHALLSREPAWQEFVEGIEDFLAKER